MDVRMRTLLAAMARSFAAEGRAGGEEAALALNQVLSADPADPPGVLPQALCDLPAQALKDAEGPIATAVRAAIPILSWHHSGLGNGTIRHEIAIGMLTAEVIGPDGMYHHPTVRVGLFAQSAGLDYVTRRHPAEETFTMVGGHGIWCVGDNPAVEATEGDVLFHTSNAPHSSVTRDRPLIALWRWAGDISYDGYELTG